MLQSNLGQLSLISILFLLVKVRMSVGVGLTASAQIFAADDHLAGDLPDPPLHA